MSPPHQAYLRTRTAFAELERISRERAKEPLLYQDLEPSLEAIELRRAMAVRFALPAGLLGLQVWGPRVYWEEGGPWLALQWSVNSGLLDVMFDTWRHPGMPPQEDNTRSKQALGHQRRHRYQVVNDTDIAEVIKNFLPW